MSIQLERERDIYIYNYTDTVRDFTVHVESHGGGPAAAAVDLVDEELIFLFLRLL